MAISSFTFFIFAVFLIGLLLLTAYSSISEANKNARIGSNLSRAILGLYTLGIIFLVFGVCFAVAKNQCMCQESSVTTGLMYMLFGLVLGVTMAALGGIIVSEGNKENSIANSLAVTIMVTGIVFSVAMIALFIFMYKDKMSAWFKGKKSSEDKKQGVKDIEPPSLLEQYKIPQDKAKANEMLKRDVKEIEAFQGIKEDYKQRLDSTRRHYKEASNSFDMHLSEKLGNEMQELDKKIKDIEEQIHYRNLRDGIIKKHLYSHSVPNSPVKAQQAQAQNMLQAIREKREEEKKPAGGLPGFGLGFY